MEASRFESYITVIAVTELIILMFDSMRVFSLYVSEPTEARIVRHFFIFGKKI